MGRSHRRLRNVETRSLPTLTHCFPRNFTFYVSHPIRSIHEQAGYSEASTIGDRRYPPSSDCPGDFHLRSTSA